MSSSCLRAVLCALGVIGAGTAAVRGDIILSATEVNNTVVTSVDDSSVVELVAPQTAPLPPEPGVTGVKLWGEVQWQNAFDGNSHSFGLSWSGNGSGTLTADPIRVGVNILVTVAAGLDTFYDLQVATRWGFSDDTLLAAGYVAPVGAGGNQHLVDTFTVAFPESYVGKTLESYEIRAMMTMSAVPAGAYTLSIPASSIDVGTPPGVVVPEPGAVTSWCVGLLALCGAAIRSCTPRAESGFRAAARPRSRHDRAWRGGRAAPAIRGRGHGTTESSLG